MQKKTLQERGQQLVDELDNLILEAIGQFPNGLRNIEVAKALGIDSPAGSNQKNWITWQALKKLQAAGIVETDKGKLPRYRIKNASGE